MELGINHLFSFRALVFLCCCLTPCPFLQLGGVTLLSSGLLVNAVFMVLTPEPFALGMGTAAGSGPGGGEDGSPVLPRGPEPSCWGHITHF